MEDRDRVILVTGASSGIGRAAAIGLGRAGARVVLCARRVSEGEKTAEQVRAAGGEAVFERTDVSKSSDVERAVATALDRFGRLDGAVNNAGVDGPNVKTADYDEAAWRRVLDTNLTGLWLCMKHEIPAMLQSGGGAIVNVASVLGLYAYPTASAYVASKHGVVGLTRTAAVEYARHGIRVNAVCPGYVPTELSDKTFSPERRDRVVAMTPMKRPGTPEEIAEVILWLLSDASSFVTGHALVADGGLTLT